MRVSLLAVALLLALAPRAQAEDLYMFRGSAWVCDSPQTYEVAVGRAKAEGATRALRRELAEVCIHVEDKDQEDIMPPFIRRLGDENGMARVVFMLRSERRRALLDRSITQTQYRGWTAADRLQPREEWLKIGK